MSIPVPGVHVCKIFECWGVCGQLTGAPWLFSQNAFVPEDSVLCRHVLPTPPCIFQILCFSSLYNPNTSPPLKPAAPCPFSLSLERRGGLPEGAHALLYNLFLNGLGLESICLIPDWLCLRRCCILLPFPRSHRDSPKDPPGKIACFSLRSSPCLGGSC